MWIKESLESCCFSQQTANFMINHSHNEQVDVSIMKDDKSGKIEKYRHVCSSLKQQFCQFIAYLWIKFNGHYSLRIEEFCQWLRKPRNYFKVFLQIPPNFKIQILDVIVESHVMVQVRQNWKQRIFPLDLKELLRLSFRTRMIFGYKGTISLISLISAIDIS